MAVAAGTAWPSRSAIAPRRVSRSFIRDLLLYENGYTTCYNIRMRLHDYAPRPAHLKWLLDSDPSIRWQVMRDLTGEAPAAIAAERSRVATEGWGAQLLTLQSPNGNWG